MTLGLGVSMKLSDTGGAWFNKMPANGVNPSMVLNFAKNLYYCKGVRALSNLITTTRSTTATYFNSAGIMQTAAIDTPRIDYNPTTGDCRGLLIEGQRTNLMTLSETITSWTQNVSPTITDNASTSPTGVLNADRVYMSQQYSGVYKTVTYSSATAYTISYFLKWESGNPSVYLNGSTSAIWGSSTAGRVTYNWSTDSFSGVGSQVTRTVSEDVGGGWRRISITATTTGAGSGGVEFYNATASTTASWLLWGVQVEAGSFSSSYIPTSGASVTRSADLFENTALNTVPFADWYSQTEGAFFCDFYAPYDSGFKQAFSVGDGTSSEYMMVSSNNGNGQLFARIQDGGVVQMAAYRGASAFFTGFKKLAFAYKLNNSNFCLIGVSGTADTSCTLPTVSKLRLGSQSDGGAGSLLYGWIKEFRFYPIRVTDQELERITL